MSAKTINIDPWCCSCGSKLSLEEMHYYDHGDGNATCNECEKKWCDAIEEWRKGDPDYPTPMPERP